MFNKNGATVVHGVKKVRDRMDVEPEFAERVRTIRASCEEGLK